MLISGLPLSYIEFALKPYFGPNVKWKKLSHPILSPFLFRTYCIQGHRTRFETFQTNNLSWFNDILIKIKTFLKSWDREIWYKRFNLCTIIFSWSQFLHICKNQQVFCLIFAAITTKTNWSRRNLQSFSRFWRNQY